MPTDPTRRALLGGLTAAAIGCVPGAEALAPTANPAREIPVAKPRALGTGFARGMNFAHLHERGYGYGSARARIQAERLWALGVRNVALNPFCYMTTLSSEEVQFGGDSTLRDEDLRAQVAQLRELGFEVTLKPHLWSWAFVTGKGNGDLEFSAAGWIRWFESYTRWAVHCAQIAAETGCTHLCVGLEFTSATRNNPGAWAKVAAACRQRFPGKLLYAANWYEEFQIFADWDAFDLIGVNAYFPLVGTTTEALVTSWGPHLDAIAAVAKGRPVVFPECGYRSVVGGTEKPWDPGNGAADPATQARGYEALFRAASARPWFQGAWFWKWFTDLPGENDPFVPADQPAEGILRAWYSA